MFENSSSHVLTYREVTKSTVSFEAYAFKYMYDEDKNNLDSLSLSRSMIKIVYKYKPMLSR